MVSFGSQIDFSVPHIKIRQLNKFYHVQNTQVHALKDIHLDIPQGKILGIIGKSGAGKSSLLRTLNGLEQANEGSIHIHQQQRSPMCGDANWFRQKPCHCSTMQRRSANLARDTHLDADSCLS